MGTWLNADGLYIKSGVDEAKHATGGAYAEGGAGITVIEVDLDATKLATASQTILSDTIFVPKGFRVEGVEVYVTQAFTSGGAATLDVGLVRTDRATELDHDGFVAAQALAGLINNAKVNGSGALVGTSLANAGHLVAKAGTAAFTAGKAKVRLKLNKV